jgi:hypothetical protein
MSVETMGEIWLALHLGQVRLHLDRMDKGDQWPEKRFWHDASANMI